MFIPKVPLGMTTIADKLTSTGYQCHQLGKWHCGMSGLDRVPVSRGFASSFGYLSGAEDHYLMTRDGYVRACVRACVRVRGSAYECVGVRARAYLNQ